jgi:hypothetical protein
MKKIAIIGLSYMAVAACWWLPSLSSNRMAVASGGSQNSKQDLQDVRMTHPALSGTPARKGFHPSTNTERPKPNPQKKLKIEVEVSTPEDLKVKEGQTVKVNQLVADRSHERANLIGQLAQVKLSIERLRSAPEVSTVPPTAVKELKSLPPQASYVEEQAQVKGAEAQVKDLERKYQLAQNIAIAPVPETGRVRVVKQAIGMAKSKVTIQQQKIDAIGALTDADPAIKQHEMAKLKELQKVVTELEVKLEPEEQLETVAKSNRVSQLEAVRLELSNGRRELDLARARLVTAQTKRKQLEFDYQVKQTERTDQIARTELERVKLLETNKLTAHDREYQIGSLVLKKNAIERSIATLPTIRANHGGTIRRVKLLGQQNNMLKYEIVLAYSVGPSKPNQPTQSKWTEES